MNKVDDKNLNVIGLKIIDQKETKDGGYKVIGWASKDNLDTMEEIVPVDTISKAVNSYARFSNIRQMHNPFLGGAGVAKVLIVEDSGLWLEAELFDDDVIKKVQAGVYKGFSIGYLTRDYTYNDQGHKVLTDIELVEISVVDRPMNVKALLSHGTEFKVEQFKVEGDQPMSYVLNNEDKAKMPDESFGFVGMVDGKFTRILPYKDLSGKVNADAAVASLNILNSNREDDIAHLESSEKKEIYKTISAALEEDDYSSDIPELVLGDDVEARSVASEQSEDEKPAQESKTIGSGATEYEEMEVSDIKTLRAELDAIRKEQGNQSSIFKKFAESMKGALKGKGIEMNEVMGDVDGTNYEELEDVRNLKEKLRNIAYVLDGVLYNILYNEDLSAEDKELKAIKAFNAAKSDWVSSFKTLAAMVTKSPDEKAVKSESETKEEAVDGKTVVIDGVKYAPVEDGKASDTPEEEVEEVEEEAPEPEEDIAEDGPDEEKIDEADAPEEEEEPADEEEKEELEEEEEGEKSVSPDEVAELRQGLKAVKSDLKKTKTDLKAAHTQIEELGGQVNPSSQDVAEDEKVETKSVDVPLGDEPEDFWE